MPSSSTLTQSMIVEKHTKTGSFVYSYTTQKMTWSDNVLPLLQLSSLSLEPSEEWKLPCFSEHTQRLIKSRIAASKANKTLIDIRIPGLNNNGEDSWFRYCCEFVDTDDGLCRVGFFQDITSSVKTLEAGNQQSDRIKMDAVSPQAGTWDYQVQSNELFWDDAMHLLFGTQNTFKLMTFSDGLACLHPESRDDFIDSFNMAIQSKTENERLNKTVRIITPNDETKYVKFDAVYVRDELHNIVSVFGTCIDVTTSELQTQGLLELASLAQKNEMIAQDAIAARSRFIANVSHEIRTPMNAIMGALQILQSFEFNDEIQSVLEMANISSHDLLSTITDLLDLSQVDAKTLDIDQIDINVSQLVQNAVSKYTSQLNPNVKLKADIAADMHINRLGDPIRFNQVINNLLSNAVKFTLVGEITIAVNGDAQNVTVSVNDTGVGIAKENLSLIFEAFRQTDESTTRQFGGSGLGLAISSKLAQLMGGSISVSSSLINGSEFRLFLPMPIIQENVTNLADNTLSDAAPDLSRHHILFAEDNDVSIDIIKQLLRPTKAKLTAAIDGKQAFDIYKKSKLISVVILDLDLPILDGLKVCERIRKENKSIPIIAMATKVSINDQKHYFNTGFTHIIEKPIMFDNFFSTLAGI